MKTTVEISDPLLREAKTLAEREGTTLRALLEEGLRKVLRKRHKSPSFRLPDASFGGRGLQVEFRDADWSTVRKAVYKGRD